MGPSSRLVTHLLGVKTPVLCAPMAGAAGGDLAAQVTLGGGFGMMGALFDDFARFKSELDRARSLISAAQPSETFVPPSQGDPLPVGVGFIGFILDAQSKEDTETGEVVGNVEQIDIALDSHVKALWFSFGVNLGKYIRYVRKEEARRNGGGASTTNRSIIFVQINSVEEARIAAQDWGVDVIVAQGIEAGGHGHGQSPPIMSLVPEVQAMLKKPTPNGSALSNPPLVLAAGGIGTGAHLAAVLALGAAGAVLGTRFLLTDEAKSKQVQKTALLRATCASTVRTTVFDDMRGIVWPSGIDGRVLANTTTRRLEKGEKLEDVKADFERATREEDVDGVLVWAGTGVGLVSEIKPAADLVRELHQEMIEHLHAASSLFPKAP